MLSLSVLANKTSVSFTGVGEFIFQ